MKVSIFASLVLLLSAFAALGHTAGINILPNDAALELRRCAAAAGWRAANIRVGYTGDAENDNRNIDRSIANFKRIMAGIISGGVADKIRSMFVFSGWHTANTRAGYSSDAGRDKARVNSRYDQILNSGEIGRTLLNNIRSMGWAAAWYAANIRANYRSDASRDQRKFAARYDNIRGTVTLVAVRFMSDQFQSFQVAPRVVLNKRLPNCGSTVSTAECSDSMSKGRTYSYTHEVGFEFTITGGFEAEIGFLGIGGTASFEAGFAFSESHSITQSFETTTTQEYSFTLQSAPHSTHIGIGTVQEATGSVPYEMTFDFGGVHKTIQGTWSGVLVTDVVFATAEVTHNPAECPS